MEQAVGQNQDMVEKRKKNIVICLFVMAVVIIVAIITILLTRKTTPTPDSPVATTGSQALELNEASEKLYNIISSAENQSEKTEQIEQLDTHYSEIYNNPSSTTDNKVTATIQLSKINNLEKDYSKSIDIIEGMLGDPNLNNGQAALLLSQLEATYLRAANKAGQIDTINRILSLPDDTDLTPYNTDIAAIKVNYQDILEQLEQ